MPRPQWAKQRPQISSQTLTRWSTRAALLVLVLIAGSLLVGFVRMTWTLQQIKQAQAQAEAKVAEAKQVALQRKGEAEYRESDVYAEQAAREQLGYARDGDTVILPTVVAPVPPTTVPTVQPEASAPVDVADDPAANYQRWWAALFPEPERQP